MDAQIWAIVGVVVGAVLGGGAQIVADVLRGRRERARWIDDHRRVAYLAALVAIEDFIGALWADVRADRDLRANDSVTYPPFRDAFHRAAHSVEFYGSPEVIRLLNEVGKVLTGDLFKASRDNSGGTAGFVEVMLDGVRPKLNALSAAMRVGLGIENT